MRAPIPPPHPRQCSHPAPSQSTSQHRHESPHRRQYPRRGAPLSQDDCELDTSAYPEKTTAADVASPMGQWHRCWRKANQRWIYRTFRIEGALIFNQTKRSQRSIPPSLSEARPTETQDSFKCLTIKAEAQCIAVRMQRCRCSRPTQRCSTM